MHHAKNPLRSTKQLIERNKVPTKTKKPTLLVLKPIRFDTNEISQKEEDEVWLRENEELMNKKTWC